MTQYQGGGTQNTKTGRIMERFSYFMVTELTKKRAFVESNEINEMLVLVVKLLCLQEDIVKSYE